MRSNHSSPNSLRHFWYCRHLCYSDISRSFYLKEAFRSFQFIENLDSQRKSNWHSKSIIKSHKCSLLLRFLSYLTGYDSGFCAIQIRSTILPVILPHIFTFHLLQSSQYTRLIISAFEDELIQITKLKSGDNYQPWAICVQAALERKAMWEIVDGIIEKSMLPAINAT